MARKRVKAGTGSGEAPRKRGRPPIVVAEKDRRVAALLAGLGVDQRNIAMALGIGHNTLAKHFRSELDNGKALVEARLAGNMFRMASGDNAHAYRAMVFLLRTRFGWSEYQPPVPVRERAEPLKGKKEQQQEAAEVGHVGTEWDELLLQ